MPRYRIIIEYDGTPFVGCQVQPAGRSVQVRLMEAWLPKMLGPAQPETTASNPVARP